MPVKVEEARDEDMERIFEISSLAFARNEPLWDIMYPKHWLESGRKVAAERMRQIKNTDRHTKFIKAVDDTTGEILGMSKWNIYNNELPDMDSIKTIKNYWDNDEEYAYATTMMGVFVETRNAAIRESKGNLVSLDILAIDPAHQRKGVGGALVQWGTQKADELGVEAVVESSVFGKGLYEKNGFVFKKDVEMWAPKDGPHSHRPMAGQFAWLVRPRKVRYEDTAGM